MNELSPRHIATLERLIEAGFSIVAFPLYGNAVGIRKGNYAALLDPVPGGDLRLYGDACMLLEGNLAVRVTEKGKSWFVWKKLRVEATRDCISELDRFVSEIKTLLEPYL